MNTPGNPGPPSDEGYPIGAQPIPGYDAPPAPPTALTPYQPAIPNPYGPPIPGQNPVVQYNVYGPPAQPTNGLAVTGFVLSLVGFIPYIGLLSAIGGIIFSLIGMSQTKRTGQGGRGLAIAGVCISGVILAFYVIALIIAIVIFAGAASTATYR